MMRLAPCLSSNPEILLLFENPNLENKAYSVFELCSVRLSIIRRGSFIDHLIDKSHFFIDLAEECGKVRLVLRAKPKRADGVAIPQFALPWW